uniref:Myb/SANT-like domain-containing protein n=2 Tax=Kalanchoe fedtschenkoi TaxID=63787 RepID=A0A7N0RA10_KALFE
MRAQIEAHLANRVSIPVRILSSENLIPELKQPNSIPAQLIRSSPSQSEMGLRAHKNGDRLRTVWTPEMDRCFIDLMLEHVQKGHRVDDTSFTKQAWKQMMSSFNSKFKCQYEKDILKNRHKTLRNLYRTVKGLLSHGGFSWDEMRHMVTAENSFWEEYIKTHPEARCFRIKTIPYYRDLCTIYEKAHARETVSEAAEGCSDMSGVEDGFTKDVLPATSDNKEPGKIVVFSLTGEQGGAIMGEDMCREGGGGDLALIDDANIDGDYSISTEDLDISPPDITKTTSSTTSTRTRTYWQPPMDRFFIDLMLKEVRRGNQMDGVFRKHTWGEMISLFNAKFGFKYDVDILKNRYKTLRKQYNVIKKLLEMDGFRWDDMRQMVAADDFVWQEYIKEHTDARQFMTRPVPYYKELCIICRDLNNDNGDDPCDRIVYPASSEKEDQLVVVSVDEISSQKSVRELENPNLPNPKKACLDTDHVSADEPAMYSFSHSRIYQEMPNTPSIETVVQAVQSLPDMDEDLILDACDLLEDEKKVKTFLALDVKLRKKWLIRKLRPQ